MSSYALEIWFDFVEPVGIAAIGSLPIIFLGSALAAALGCSVVISGRHNVPFGSIAPFAAASLLLLLFYPKQISQASLGYLLQLCAGGKFAQSVWGLTIINIPAAAGVAYLLISTTVALSDYIRLPANFIKNSGRAPIVRTCIIAVTPLRNPLALSVALLCCITAFQAALLGRSGASTVGSQIARGLRRTELSDSERILLLGSSIAYLMVVLALVFALIWLVHKLLTIVALESTARGSAMPIPSNAKLVKSIIGIATLTTLIVSVLLHSFLILRLLGLAPSLFGALDLPAGSLENTPPNWDGVGWLLASFRDPAVLGACAGFACTMLLWFMRLARNWPAPSNQAAFLIPVGFACLAFLPSTFAGSLSLALPGIGRLLPLMLFGWGALAAAGLACLLVATHLFANDTQRYANVKRTNGQVAAFLMFLREYGLVAVGVLFAVLVANVFDSGYRDQMGLSSLGTKFLDRQGDWDPARRGLALAIMFLAVLATAFFSRGVRRSTDPAWPAT